MFTNSPGFSLATFDPSILRSGSIAQCGVIVRDETRGLVRSLADPRFSIDYRDTLLERELLLSIIMKSSCLHATTLLTFSLVLISCGEDGPYDNKPGKQKEDGPSAPTTPLKPPPAQPLDVPNNTSGGTGAPGTRSDYQPSTGPGAQTETGASNLPDGSPPPKPEGSKPQEP